MTRDERLECALLLPAVATAWMSGDGLPGTATAGELLASAGALLLVQSALRQAWGTLRARIPGAVVVGDESKRTLRVAPALGILLILVSSAVLADGQPITMTPTRWASILFATLAVGFTAKDFVAEHARLRYQPRW